MASSATAGFEGEIAGQTTFVPDWFLSLSKSRNRSQDEVEVTDFEFLRNTNNNSWGVGFSEEGLLFGSTANRNPSEFMPVANRYYERVRGWTSSVLTGIADTHLFNPITETRYGKSIITTATQPLRGTRCTRLVVIHRPTGIERPS